MTAFVDTHILLRHLTGDPAEQAAAATKFLTRASKLFLADVVVAEVVYVLEFFYETPRDKTAELIRSILAFPAIAAANSALLLRTLELYEVHRLGFANAYLVAQAESSGIGLVASWDKTIDRVRTVRRVKPT